MDANQAAGFVPPAPGELRIATTWLSDCRVVTADGEIDLRNTHRLHAALSLAVHPDVPLIADLSQVTFLDSRGLLTLMSMQRNATLQGARFIVVPSPAIAALLALSAAGSLTVYPSLASALSAVRQAAPQAQDKPASPAT